MWRFFRVGRRPPDAFKTLPPRTGNVICCHVFGTPVMYSQMLGGVDLFRVLQCTKQYEADTSGMRVCVC